MACTGRRSAYPPSVDNFGLDIVDDVGEIVDAERWNKIQDALLTLQRHTLKVVQTGKTGVFTHVVSGSLRPRLLYKTYTVIKSTAASTTHTFTLSGFTTVEKALFGGAPLDAGVAVHAQIRKVDGDAFREKSYHAHLLGPLSDTSGDSGWSVAASTLRHASGDFTIPPGTYVVTVMLSR